MAISRLDLLPTELRIDIFELSIKAAFEEDMDNIHELLEAFDRTILDSPGYNKHLHGIVDTYYVKPSASLTTSTTIVSMYPAFHMIVHRFWRSTLKHHHHELHEFVNRELEASRNDGTKHQGVNGTRLGEVFVEFYSQERVHAFFGWEWQVLRHLLSTAEQIDTRRTPPTKLNRYTRHEATLAKALTQHPQHYLSQVHTKRWTQLCYSNWAFLHSYQCKEYRMRWLRAQRRLKEHKATCSKCIKQRKYRHYSQPRPWLKYGHAEQGRA